MFGIAVIAGEATSPLHALLAMLTLNRAVIQGESMNRAASQ